MESSCEELVLKPQKNVALGTLFVTTFGLMFAAVFVGINAHPLWWLLPAALVAWIFWWLLREPKSIVFRPADSTIELVFRVNALAPNRRISRFSDWRSIQSCMRADDENQRVWLELRSNSGRSLVLDVADPMVASDTRALSWKAFGEPEQTRLLREQIASMMGVQDLGFRRPFER